MVIAAADYSTDRRSSCSRCCSSGNLFVVAMEAVVAVVMVTAVEAAPSKVRFKSLLAYSYLSTRRVAGSALKHLVSCLNGRTFTPASDELESEHETAPKGLTSSARCNADKTASISPVCTDNPSLFLWRTLMLKSGTMYVMPILLAELFGASV